METKLTIRFDEHGVADLSETPALTAIFGAIGQATADTVPDLAPTFRFAATDYVCIENLTCGGVPKVNLIC